MPRGHSAVPIGSRAVRGPTHQPEPSSRAFRCNRQACLSLPDTTQTLIELHSTRLKTQIGATVSGPARAARHEREGWRRVPPLGAISLRLFPGERESPPVGLDGNRPEPPIAEIETVGTPIDAIADVVAVHM